MFASVFSACFLPVELLRPKGLFSFVFSPSLSPGYQAVFANTLFKQFPVNFIGVHANRKGTLMSDFEISSSLWASCEAVVGWCLKMCKL